VMTVTEWATVANTGDLSEDEMIGVTVDGEEILVAKVGGEYKAIGAVCTHEGGPLPEGELFQGIVTCPYHAGEFDLETGEAVTPPPTENEPVYQVRVAGDEIQVAKPGTE
jgi:nitrite reductase/ring-hydroxylating ferredoxin subunit